MICSVTFHPRPAADDCDDAAETMAAQHARMLAELADIAMQLARAAGRRALAQAEMAGADDRDDAPQGDPGLAFTRMARCVRQTLALQAKLAQADRARADARRVHPFADAGALDDAREQLRRKLAACWDDDLDDAADLDPREPGDREDVLADLHERLDDLDVAGFADGAPIEGSVDAAAARIRRDLERFSGGDGEMRSTQAAPADPWPYPAPPGRARAPP